MSNHISKVAGDTLNRPSAPVKRLMLADETVAEGRLRLMLWVGLRDPSSMVNSGDGDENVLPEGTTVAFVEGGFMAETLWLERGGIVDPEVTLAANRFGEPQGVTEVLAAVRLTAVKP
ncbi:uncharacterized protein Z519_09236 [Cladophialophora bantiana CBS 173.52]|uniref:Uncharacterized protein n=1 Tax=Cladophialophora bantiana (strain ATCC 10958 / CBS 173.52 / CDC B-1940 / NIH 8579) TaxID=1442370 RepID=A0A0D2FTC8_CLAB1|nr:uncharacterized protein Z519_09236 [Cladophialophora bantiana CBS 173.52]KIW89807.1 hypothetical protein Z519_09236 [Cladophialophora bantiana CBS 173.52]